MFKVQPPCSAQVNLAMGFLHLSLHESSEVKALLQHLEPAWRCEVEFWEIDMRFQLGNLLGVSLWSVDTLQ